MKRKEKNCWGNQETWMGRKGGTEVEAAWSGRESCEYVHEVKNE